MPESIVRADILVSPDGAGGNSYTLTDWNSQQNYACGTTTGAILDTLSESLADTYAEFRGVANRTLSQAVYDRALGSMQASGKKWYSNIVPLALRQRVDRLPDGAHVHVVSDRLDFPWELLKDGGQFWGVRFVMSRATREANIQVSPRVRRVNKIVNVVGAGLEVNLRRWALSIFDAYKKQGEIEVVNISGQEDSDATSRVIGEIPSADIIHFTCHGIVVRGKVFLKIVEDPEPLLNFRVESLQEISGLKDGCIVFANACVSTQSKSEFLRQLAFGPEFCNRSAAAFIGTLDLVNDKAAVQFARTYYQHLFQGETAGRALWLTKRVLPRSNGQLFPPSQVLYSLYGNPLAAADLGVT